MEYLKLLVLKQDLLQVLISVIVGLLIGSEREYRNKSAGLRTFILVSFGSCLFTILSIKIGIQNPDRLAANIITGIGFLGAGVIFKDDNKIGGITTATTIWATASLGMAIGSGHIWLGLLGVVLVLVILSLLTYLQDFIDNYHKIREYRIVTKTPDDVKHCEDLFRKLHLSYMISKQQYSAGNIATTWKLTGKNENHETLMKLMILDEKITGYQF